MSERLRRILVVGVVCVVCSSRAGAQTNPRSDSNVREVLPFMDATFVGFARAGDQTTFEADIVPNFVAYESLFKKLGREFSKTDRATRQARWSWSVTGVPMIRLRLFINEPSAPVRTPSYMPKGTAQALLFRPGKESDTVDLYALQATVGHHSNGQDGCLYQTSVLRGDECLPPPGGVTPTTPVNKKDGSFSTNYLQFSGRYRWVHLKEADASSPFREGDRDLTAGVELELNPGNGRFLGGGGIDPDQKAIYGPTRISGFFGAATRDAGFCYRLEGKTSVKYIHGQLAQRVGSLAETVEGACLFRDTGWGLFTRFYHGQDYYNLGFAESVTRVQFGVTYSQEGFLRFRLR